MNISPINLTIDELPDKWYNITADFPSPMPPPKDPAQGESRLKLLSEFFSAEALKQEMSQEKWTRIPEEVKELYIHVGRPRPLYRAYRLEKYLKTPAKIYYKREDLSPTGSHKVNTALAQLHYVAKEGYERVTTETGAGQWGSALAHGAALMGLKCTVYMVRFAYNLKPGRRTIMKYYGAECLPSPSNRTTFGKKLLKENPNHNGSLGIAVSEGIEDALKHDDTVYCLGSVLNHVLLHQTVIGQEVIKQFEKIDETPDVMFACLGGGSNFGGFTIPMMGLRLKKKVDTRFVACQSEVSANLVNGKYEYDFGDAAEQTPLLKMFTLGHKKDMHPIYAEGLRYHAAAPVLSYLRNLGMIEAKVYPKDEKLIFEAAKIFMRTEGFIPAPESAYAIRATIDEALEARRKKEKKVIAMNISGHGFVDLEAYNKFI